MNKEANDIANRLIEKHFKVEKFIKRTKEYYGYHTQNGFDDQPTGWVFEGGEEAYYSALQKEKIIINHAIKECDGIIEAYSLSWNQISNNSKLNIWFKEKVELHTEALNILKQLL